MEECTNALKSSILNISTVTYRPSFLERIGGGYATDLGGVNGCDLFKEAYGVCIDRCSSVASVIDAVDDIIDMYTVASNAQGILYAGLQRLSTKINTLIILKANIKKVLSDDCPVCLELGTDLSFIQPCMHFTCQTCMERVGDKCPSMCRRAKVATLGVNTNVTERPCKRVRVDGGGGSDSGSGSGLGSGSGSGSVDDSQSRRIGDLFFDEIGQICGPSEPSGVAHAIENKYPCGYSECKG